MATSESTRARRFALPDHGTDERVDEAIEAFLEGPEVRRHRPPARRRARKGHPKTGAAPTAPTDGAAAASTAVVPAGEAWPVPSTPRPITDIRTIPGRLEFNAALERESARAARYQRPASVAIVELRPERPRQAIDIWLRSLAGQVAGTLRRDSRSTDLVARVASTRFQVLLPETPEAGAGRFGERISAACQSAIDASDAPVTVRVTIAAATPDHSLHEALTHALESIAAA